MVGRPVLALELLTIFLIALALAALVIALLYALARSSGVIGGGGGGGTPPPPPPTYAQSLQDLQTLLQQVKDKDSVSSDDCAALRKALEEAKDKGAPSDATDAAQTAIDALCPQ